MITLPRAKPITADEFEEFEQDCRYDLIKGELVPMPPMPGEEHGEITSDFSLEASLYVRQHELGKTYAAETRFVIEQNPDTSIGPDWAFVQKARLPAKRSPKFSRIIPDAILEVRSPSDIEDEAVAKMKRWIDAGVRMGWELNPKTQTMTVYRPGQETVKLGIDDVISGEDVLPGFRLPMKTLFPDEE